MVEERTLERPAGIDVGTALLDEYMELKGELGPLEKRMREVRDRLRDLVTEHGSTATSWMRLAVSLSVLSLVSARSMTPSDSSPSFPGWLGA